MNSLTDRFKQPIPAWVKEIKNEALQKISLSPFATACRAGDMGLTKELFLRFWPFVDAFPKIINRGCLHILKRELVRTFGLEMIDLFRLGFEVLSHAKGRGRSPATMAENGACLRAHLHRSSSTAQS